ncbi:MAG: hypothetical protein ACE5H3_06225 [Planctomycetota bacterium]
MKTLLLLFFPALLSAASACSGSDGDRPETPDTTKPDQARAPDLAPIPDTVPDLPAGTNAIMIQLSGEVVPGEGESDAARFIQVDTGDTEVRVEVAPSDDQRGIMEKMARRFLADGWNLHLEPGPQPRLYLYLPPGPITLNCSVASHVPGLAVEWALTPPPRR